jgi:hypothetical protein
MKKVILNILLTMVVLLANGQTTEEILRERMIEVEKYHDDAKVFRNTINSWYREENKDTTNKYGVIALENLALSLGEKFKIKEEYLDKKNFKADMKDPFSEDERNRLINAQNSNEQILILAEILNKKPYDPLLILLELEPLKTSDSIPRTYKDELIQQFNTYQASFGRRLGRLVQNAIIQEDVYYVTPKSWERFFSSLYELHEVAQNLDQEIQSTAPSSSTNMTFNPSINIDYQVNSEKPIIRLEQQGAYLVTDFRQSYGVGWYGAFKYIDLGLDILYTGENGTGLKFHPKIGAGKGIIHFAVGGLANTTNGTFEVSGNLYLIFKDFTGGIGVTQNSVLFSFGVNPDFIN